MFPKRRLLAVGIFALISALLFLAIPRRKFSAAILDAKFRLLSVKLSQGKIHKLYRNGPVAGRIQELIHLAGSKYGYAPLLGFTTNVTDALVVRFTGDFPPNALAGVQAEVVDDSGATNRLWCIAGYNAGTTPSQYGTIWALDRPPTNVMTIRLMLPSGKPSLAEIRWLAP